MWPGIAWRRLVSARVRLREGAARLKAGARREEIEAARARVAAVDAQIATYQKAIDDAVVKAPAAGVVTSKLVNVGEIVAPRAPLVVMTDLDHAWGEVFVDEPLVPRLALGQPATLYTDAGGEGLAGKVTFISPKAEFTPRNVQTAEERSRLVYRIKVTVDNTKGVLKPGMPVEAELPLRSGRRSRRGEHGRRTSLDWVTKRYGEVDGRVGPVLRRPARRDVRADRARRGRQDDDDSPALRPAAHRRRIGPGAWATTRCASMPPSRAPWATCRSASACMAT